MEQLAPHEKVFVDSDIFDDDENHGALACQDCHGGDPKETDFTKAHHKVVRDPSYPAPGACAECHDVDHYQTSLHASIAPIKQSIMNRAKDDPSVKAKLNTAFNNHCASCHSSCGQCHISRPSSVGGGLMAGHAYEKRAQVKETCTACHGSRVGKEYFGEGKNCKPDIHRQKAFMKCSKCHTAEELHGQGKTPKDRYHAAGLPQCRDCHEKVFTEPGPYQTVHLQHEKKASCQVCHAQPYTNCFSCHVKMDKQGQKYYEVKAHRTDFKIGLNPDRTDRRPEKFVVLRHVPIDQDTFKHYVDQALTNFDRVPTWKPASPHNIRRKTDQNAECNHCHGQKRLFLRENDVEERYRKANEPVIVPTGKIPAKIIDPKTALTKKKPTK